MPTLLATAEHEYTRYGYKQLLDGRLVDILQPDIAWLGGLTEAKKVVAMAAATNTLVIPHCSGVFSFHLVLSSPNCPMSEYPALHPRAMDAKTGLFKGLFEGEPLPANGYIDIPDKPGFGLELIRDNLRRPYDRDISISRAQAEANIAEIAKARLRPARMRL